MEKAHHFSFSWCSFRPIELVFLGSHTAAYILLNNTNNIYGLDLLTWKIINKGLPNLAVQIVEDGKTPEGQTELYRTLACNQWWQKNVIPSYALSNADTKDLAGIGKEFDGASTKVLSLAVNAGASSKEKVTNAVRGASQFLRSRGVYLQIPIC
jgi:hypothetical protein